MINPGIQAPSFSSFFFSHPLVRPRVHVGKNTHHQVLKFAAAVAAVSPLPPQFLLSRRHHRCYLATTAPPLLCRHCRHAIPRLRLRHRCCLATTAPPFPSFWCHCCPFPVVSIPLPSLRRRRRGHPDVAAATVAFILLLTLLLSAYCFRQSKLATSPSLFMLSCFCCCCHLAVLSLVPSQANITPLPLLPSFLSSYCRRFDDTSTPGSRRRHCCRFIAAITAIVRI